VAIQSFGGTLSSSFTGKKALVTGGTGTIGREIVRQLLQGDVERVHIFSRSEHEQFLLQHELEASSASRIKYMLGDVRDLVRVSAAAEGVDLIFHAAAMKHVPACEFNPHEAAQINVQGTQNVVEAGLRADVEKVINISTDKAIEPTSALGATKLLAERIISSAHMTRDTGRTKFCSVRFGNVLGSRGSVLPLWLDQMRRFGRISVTDPDMTRFVMSVPQAVRLVFRAHDIAVGGEVFVLKVSAARLGDLAEVVVEEFGESVSSGPIEIQVVGKRPGERTREILFGEEEARFVVEVPDMFILRPDLMDSDEDTLARPYLGGKATELAKCESRTESLLEKDDLRAMIKDSDVRVRH